MAHQLSENAEGVIEFAFTGDRSQIWHGLGNQVEENADLETWIAKSGMHLEIVASPIQYSFKGELRSYNNRVALHRGDDGRELSIVSDSFKVVQPAEILEFFRDIIQTHGMKLTTAGILFDGRRYFASAELGRSLDLNGDKVDGYLLLTTAVDGSLATTARFVATRVVCNNTLTIAMGEKAKHNVKQNHSKVFDPKAFKLELGLVDDAWAKFQENVRLLANTKMTDEQVVDLYRDEFYDPKLGADQPKATLARVDKLLSLYKGAGRGADMAYGTAWGALNAVTELYTHGTGRASQSSQFWHSTFGEGDKIKSQVMSKLLELA